MGKHTVKSASGKKILLSFRGLFEPAERGGSVQTVTAENMRRLEAAVMKEGVTESSLMENAGAAAAREIGVRYQMKGRSVAILCGGGNNGGDGYVTARLLSLRGAKVTVITAAEPQTPSAKRAAELADDGQAQFLSLSAEPYLAAACVRQASLIVDGVYGIGFHGKLPDGIRSLFRVINALDIPVVALDVPSGMHADTGQADGDTLKADLTVTFTAAKPGFTVPAARTLIGELKVVSVGIDARLTAMYAAHVEEIIPDAVQACFPRRAADSHKGNYGRLLCFAGSEGMAGAAIMAGTAALRCGLGLLEMAVSRSLYAIMAGSMPQAVFTLLPRDEEGGLAPEAGQLLISRANRASAALIGCGLSCAEATAGVILALLKNLSVPAVADADGLNILAQHPEAWNEISAPLVITPHPGEMARLTGLTVEDIQADRVGAARRFAAEKGVTVVLKGYRTVVASPDGQAMINPTGCPGMATGGSGDVLAGMIASFLAQGQSPMQAAMCGVYLHGAAGEIAAEALSQISMLPTDIIEALPKLFAEIENRQK